ncbi:MAG: toll/interleukin-1 receptor domain-containing protein [Eubacteriales bacterium]|nr:toll/interleukin-1 receptor domain-containing protein [Eubacteriales bacterium]
MSAIESVFDNRPYIFFSYAHENALKALKIVSALREEGFRVWYDDGLQPGDKYNQIIDVRIKKCEVFIPYLTKEYCASDYCVHELIYSQEAMKKQMIPVFSEHPSGLSRFYPLGLGLWLSGRSGIVLENPDNLSFFRNQIRGADILSPCRNIRIDGNKERSSPCKALVEAEKDLRDAIEKLPPETAKKAGRLLKEAEAAYERKEYSDTINTLHACVRVLNLNKVSNEEPAYICWKIADAYTESGGDFCARLYYDKAVKKMPALRDKEMEEKIQDLARRNSEELKQIEESVQKISPSVREAWEQDLQKIFDQHEKDHPFTPEDYRKYQEISKEMKKPYRDAARLVTLLSPLAKKYPRAEYLMGQLYDSIDQVGYLSYWGCASLLGKYPAGLCLKAVESSIKKKSLDQARMFYRRLRIAAPEIS